MKKIISFICTLLILIPVIGIFDGERVNGLTRNDYNYYPYGCNLNEYEVSYIENDGSLRKVSCHSDFEEAKETMYSLGKEYVVRHGYSLSPTKIVAMVEGKAYTYPGRSNQVLMEFYEYQPNEKGSDAYTYTSENYEVGYYDTTYMSSNSFWLGTGYAKVNLNGFVGYCDLENLDLVPSKYIDNEIPIILGGNNTYSGESPYSITLKYSNYQLKDNVNYTDLCFSYYYAWPNSDGIAKHYNLYVDSANAYTFMKKGVSYYTDNGYDYYSDPYYQEFVGTVYNYYQFMPLRCKTNIDASTFDSFLLSVKGSDTKSVMKNKGQAFIDAQNEYGMNALMIYAMACQESAYGESNYAINRYNLFGWNAVDSSPDRASYFDSVEQCIQEQMGSNLRGYCDVTDTRYFGSYIGNKGNGFNVRYCSDPYWGLKISAIAYKIDKYSCNNDGTLKEHDSNNIAILNNRNTCVYADNQGNKTMVSPYKKHSTYQYVYSTIVYGQEYSYTKCSSSNAIKENEILTEDAITSYDFSNSIQYIATSDLQMIYGSNKVLLSNMEIKETPSVNSKTDIFSINSISMDENEILIQGIGIMSGIDFSNQNDVFHAVLIYDHETGSLIKSLSCDNVDLHDFSLNDGVNYRYGGYQISISLQDLNVGDYYFKLYTKVKDYSSLINLKSYEPDFSSFTIKNDTNTYYLKTNYLYDYRYELSVLSSPLDYCLKNTPSTRQSLLSFKDILLDENGNLEIDAYGFIYYLDYQDLSVLDYDVYLIQDDSHYIKMETSNYACPINYSELLASSYNLDNICFKAETNVKDLDGEYDIVVKIQNKEYVDYVELCNESLISLPNCEIQNKNINILTKNTRYRLALMCEEVE